MSSSDIPAKQVGTYIHELAAELFILRVLSLPLSSATHSSRSLSVATRQKWMLVRSGRGIRREQCLLQMWTACLSSLRMMVDLGDPEKDTLGSQRTKYRRLAKTVPVICFAAFCDFHSLNC
jgi:hypothetical protein